MYKTTLKLKEPEISSLLCGKNTREIILNYNLVTKVVKDGGDLTRIKNDEL